MNFDHQLTLNMKNYLTKFLTIAALALALTVPALAQTGPAAYRVNTINALLQINLYGTSGVAWVGGGATLGDGLGGVFYYDSTSSAATNVYMIYKPVSDTGRWYKHPTAIVNQNDAVTVATDTTYAWKLLRAGQTNFFGIGADNNIAYLQTFNGKNLHINNVGNDVIVNGAGTGGTVVGNTLIVTNATTLRSTLAVGGGAAVTAIYSAAAQLDFGSIAANTAIDLTITVAGAGTNSVATVSRADGAMTGNISHSAWVSSTNTVTVRALNPTVGAIDPAAGSFRTTVFQY